MFVEGNEFQGKQLNAESEGSALISDNIIKAASQLTVNEEVVFTGNTIEGDLDVESEGSQHVSSNTFNNGDLTLVGQHDISLQGNEGAIGQAQITAQDVSLHRDHLQASGPVSVAADTLHLNQVNVSSEETIEMVGKHEFSANQSNLTADDAVDVSGSGSAFIQNSTLEGGNATSVDAVSVCIKEAPLTVLKEM